MRCRGATSKRPYASPLRKLLCSGATTATEKPLPLSSSAPPLLRPPAPPLLRPPAPPHPRPPAPPLIKLLGARCHEIPSALFLVGLNDRLGFHPGDRCQKSRPHFCHHRCHHHCHQRRRRSASPVADFRD